MGWLFDRDVLAVPQNVGGSCLGLSLNSQCQWVKSAHWINENSSTFKISCHFLESTEFRKPRISKSQDQFIFFYSFYSSQAKTEFFALPNKAACLFML